MFRGCTAPTHSRLLLVMVGHCALRGVCVCVCVCVWVVRDLVSCMQSLHVSPSKPHKGVVFAEVMVQTIAEEVDQGVLFALFSVFGRVEDITVRMGTVGTGGVNNYH